MFNSISFNTPQAACLQCSKQAKPPYLVKVTVDQYSGTTEEYHGVDQPRDGQEIFHGAFDRRVRYTGSNDAEEVVYFVPRDPARVTSETYNAGGLIF